MSLDVGYFRRWYGNFVATDNLAVSSSDFDTFSIVAVDARLPDGGGIRSRGSTTSSPEVQRAGQQLRDAVGYLRRQIQHWNGVDVNVNLRARNGVFVQGGTSTGRTSTDNCEVGDCPSSTSEHLTAAGHELADAVQAARVVSDLHIGVQVSGTVQSLPGPVIGGSQRALRRLWTRWGA
jgi:hypothetical protein